MARRGSFIGLAAAVARDSARRKRLAEAAQKRVALEEKRRTAELSRMHQQRDRELAKTHKELERLEKEQYYHDRHHEVELLNDAIVEQLQAIESILPVTLDKNDAIDFESLMTVEPYPRFSLPSGLPPSTRKPELERFLRDIVEPKGLSALIPGAKRKYLEKCEAAERSYAFALNAWESKEHDREQQIASLRNTYESDKHAHDLKVAQRNDEIRTLQECYINGDPDAIIAYNTMVLERSLYPDEFPHAFSIAYTSDSRQLVIEYELPSHAAVPEILEFKYLKTKDQIINTPRKVADIRAIFQDLIAAISLRTIHEVMEADIHSHVDVVCLNGYVKTIDPATGRDIQPHLISVRTTKERFLNIDLARVDKKICLKNLGASVSRQPDEAQAVKPIVEFNMADARFIDQTDMVSGLSSAPNLMDLTPGEFEHLVANLFGRMGLESKLTRSSRDGGVDCVAYDSRPVLGGKVVIQAKRYRHTVGVSAVRDLYGTMMNEGANKGILVTTSGYGPDAFEFAKDKPIELIEGGNLLFLLNEIGQQARIVFPEDS